MPDTTLQNIRSLSRAVPHLSGLPFPIQTKLIGVGQLRYILTNLGEKMSDEEVDELLKGVNVDTSSGEVNYVELVRTILAN